MDAAKRTFWKAFGLAEQIGDAYEKPGSALRDEDRRLLEAVLRASPKLALKKRIKASEFSRFIDALASVIALKR